MLICGGGCAGIAAAVSAARQGCRVALLERWPTIGGMATNALVNGWHRSDREKVVINGLVEECVQRLYAEGLGWVAQVPRFPHAHETHWFEPEGMRIIWQRMLDEAGVRVFCNIVAGEPVLKDGQVHAVLVDTKEGRRAIKSRIFVDATGDGDVASKAGVPFDFGRSSDGLVQGMTLIFALAGLDYEAFNRADAGHIERVWEQMKALRGRGALPPFNEANTLHFMRNQPRGIYRFWNLLPVNGNPLDEEELSRLTALARERLLAYLHYWRKELPGLASATIEQTGFGLGVRESRRVRGLKTLDRAMVLGAAKHADAIGHGVWMVGIHDPQGSGHTTHSDRKTQQLRLEPGTSYHIPLGMCVNNVIPNLAVVGRCASATHEALSSVRVQTHCMIMGEGIGTAAALALESNTSLPHVDIPRLQRALKSAGVYLEDVPRDPDARDA